MHLQVLVVAVVVIIVVGDKVSGHGIGPLDWVKRW